MSILDLEPTLQLLQDYYENTDRFQAVLIGEPKAPPSGDYTAALFPTGGKVVQVPLAGPPTECHDVLLRIYRNMLALPTEDTETEIMRCVAAVMDELYGHFTVGGTIRNVDLGGEFGESPNVKYGYLEVSGTMYRIADVRYGLVVDPDADEASMVP